MNSPPDRTAGLAPIRADEIYAWSLFKRRMGLCQKSARALVTGGLRQVVAGKRRFVLGADVLEFFRRLAEGQDRGEEAGTNA
ncbi:MAG: hypothetical protein JXB10_01425 [Pirellulales bacterium]|nr:hypothetical protein [Pirellulales bacterium]